ncbi:hypothetical protein [Shewanella sp. GXUN23E]|uniref:hypothetical protein n=1 Tax=Shewanella sp. GXUN23E TaxID=3422498 RepID=UPI003D7CECE6
MKVQITTLMAPLILVMSAPVFANDFSNQSAWQALQGTEGHWQGQIRYANSNPQLVDLRMNTEVTPDQETLIRYLTYADQGQMVYAVSLMTQNPETGNLVESYFRNGNGTLHRYQVNNAEFNDVGHWRISYQRPSDDGNGITKLNWQRQGGKMESKEWQCQPNGSQCQLLTETRLTRQPAQ